MSWGLKEIQVQDYAFIENAFSDDEIKQIFDLAENLDKQNGTVKELKENQTLEQVRKSKVSWIKADENSEWIYRRLTDQINSINSKFFGFDLEEIEDIQFTLYEEGDFYDKHRDHFFSSFKNPRKLSFVVQLTDPQTYEGGRTLLWIDKDAIALPNKKATISFFPSYILHEVTKITKGTRHSLVGWISGKPFR